MAHTIVSSKEMIRWRRWDPAFFIRMRELEPVMNRILKEWTQSQIQERINKLPNRVFPDLQFMAMGHRGKYTRTMAEHAPLHEQALALAAALDSTTCHLDKLREQHAETLRELRELGELKKLRDGRGPREAGGEG